jgi:hypothetical protein
VTNYGELPATTINISRRMRISVTYFETDDPNAFIAERAGPYRSASYLRIGSREFAARFEQLEQRGLARNKGIGSTEPFMGEVAEFDLYKKGFGSNVEANHGRGNVPGSSLLRMDRVTEAKIVGVSKGISTFYRVALISSFISSEGARAVKNVDLDASVLLVPGQTAIFKLMSDEELNRSRARSYLAVTIEPLTE